MNLIKKAIKYASYHHRNQKRKYTNLPYIMHPMSVAGLVSMVTDDSNMICAAILHDVVEDCEPTIFDIKKHFNDRIFYLVDKLTDISKSSDGNRAERKKMDREHSATGDADAQTIKVADLIDNTSTIVYFDENFGKVYLREKQLLLEVLTKADKKLVEIANKQVSEYYLKRQEEKQNDLDEVIRKMFEHKGVCNCNCKTNYHTEEAKKAQKRIHNVIIGK